jgi:hypothetical protein
MLSREPIFSTAWLSHSSCGWTMAPSAFYRGQDGCTRNSDFKPYSEVWRQIRNQRLKTQLRQRIARCCVWPSRPTWPLPLSLLLETVARDGLTGGTVGSDRRGAMQFCAPVPNGPVTSAWVKAGCGSSALAPPAAPSTTPKAIEGLWVPIAPSSPTAHARSSCFSPPRRPNSFFSQPSATTTGPLQSTSSLPATLRASPSHRAAAARWPAQPPPSNPRRRLRPVRFARRRARALAVRRLPCRIVCRHGLW